MAYPKGGEHHCVGWRPRYHERRRESHKVHSPTPLSLFLAVYELICPRVPSLTDMLDRPLRSIEQRKPFLELCALCSFGHTDRKGDTNSRGLKNFGEKRYTKLYH